MENKKEEIPKQEKPDYALIEYALDEAHGDLPGEMLDSLTKNIDDPRSYALLVRYLKRNMELRLPRVIRMINFKFGASPKTFDAYSDSVKKIENLLEEKDGVIDESKREQVKLLLKTIRDTKVPE